MKNFLKSIDIFDKFDNEDLKLKTFSGALLSFFLSTFGSIYFLIKLVRFITPNIYRDLTVDKSLVSGHDFVNISVNVLVNLPCYFLHLDAIDALGFSQLNINSTAQLRRIGKDGKFIGIANESVQSECYPCYGLLPDSYCCNSCEQLILLHKFRGLRATPEKWPQCNQQKPEQKVSKYEKCHIRGKVSVNRVTGNMHIAPGRNIPNSPTHQHDLSVQLPHIDLSHIINHVRFGPKIPTARNPLRGIQVKQNPNDAYVYRYNLMVTPVIYYKDGVFMNRGFEYIVQRENSPAIGRAPGIYFFYRFSPTTVRITAKSHSFAQFITSTAGFLSGSFALALMIETLIQERQKRSQKKKSAESAELQNILNE
ncbi:endoplasmic reticulum-Golgi intermediate compartment protein 3 isoform X2 [Histomonas meleagridis]|uniref:endoplasmic reticulum-Golgi intermediate compartment protein 3 isoform X2 n=1 Tax=Histomonas meleagridis TaxID=135588 RepID=UPI00355A9133|nr:endoplasmic reticulum-Golgi intermediate compartment protein 3 isoform X2 [Histomonas meleagridis]KAH0804731.1 endoplasmic reticulum-Golgi intermediate compartment protein 3 isoform X2 [Histomonas meleagridis]